MSHPYLASITSIISSSRGVYSSCFFPFLYYSFLYHVIIVALSTVDTVIRLRVFFADRLTHADNMEISLPLSLSRSFAKLSHHWQKQRIKVSSFCILFHSHTFLSSLLPLLLYAKQPCKFSWRHSQARLSLSKSNPVIQSRTWRPRSKTKRASRPINNVWSLPASN